VIEGGGEVKYKWEGRSREGAKNDVRLHGGESPRQVYNYMGNEGELSENPGGKWTRLCSYIPLTLRGDRADIMAELGRGQGGDLTMHTTAEG